MAKILEINQDSEKLKSLYKDIVRYNNSQKGIQERQFSANRSEFYRLQNEFKSHGFYLCVKQSDSYKFKKEGKLSECIINSKKHFEKFGLEQPKTLKPFIVDLEKLLQIIVAFKINSHAAVQNKSKLLKEDSKEYITILDFVRDPEITINTIIELYCFYLRIEKEKGKEKTPNSFMLIDGVSKFECDKVPQKFSKALNTAEDVNVIIKEYRVALSAYYKKYIRNNERKEYNDMIKEIMDYELLSDNLDTAKDALKEI